MGKRIMYEKDQDNKVSKTEMQSDFVVDCYLLIKVKLWLAGFEKQKQKWSVWRKLLTPYMTHLRSED